MAKRRQHVHQYHRIYPYGLEGKYSNKKNGVWACALPDCTHFMPHNVEGQVVGKLSLCNQCMEAFVLDEENMKVDKPLCNTCAHPENAVVIPDDFDFERHEARTFLSTQQGIPFDEVTEEAVDKLIALRAIQEVEL